MRKIQGQSEQWPDRVAWGGPGDRQPTPRPRDLPPVHNDDVKIMHVPEEDGPGYRAIVRPSPDGKGFDVIKRLSAEVFDNPIDLL